MERVQFQQEQMLAELKDLAENGIFSKPEIKQIMKKRTAFETALIRRMPKKADFLRYAAYEMSLEALRRKRIKRLKLDKRAPTVSTFSIQRRVFQIFERVLKKFKDDVALWLQYIRCAQHFRSRALVGRLCARALLVHPAVPALFVLAAQHERTYGGWGAARVLLQRGVRINEESVDLWREWVRLELGFVEALRRRWKVLGLDLGEEGPEPTVQVESQEEIEEAAVDDVEFEDDEKARKEVLNGALIKTIISNAAKAVPSVGLFSSLHTAISTYPCPPSLRQSLLSYLHTLLHSTLIQPSTSSPSSSKSNKLSSQKTYPQAAKLYATRFLTPDLQGGELVDALKRANEDLLDAVRRSRESKSNDDGISLAYSQFVQEWFEKKLDENLNMYLLVSLQSLCSPDSSSPSLLTMHLRLLRSSHNTTTTTTTPSMHKILKLARKYTARCPSSAELWLQRLELETEVKSDEDVWMPVWIEARKAVAGEGADKIWLWGLDQLVKLQSPLEKQISVMEDLLREASSSYPVIKDTLLIRYTRLIFQRSLTTSKNKPKRQIEDIAYIGRRYTLNGDVWSGIFDIYAGVSEATADDVDEAEQGQTDLEEQAAEEEGESAGEEVLRSIFETWRLVSPMDNGNAALKWAEWLVKHSVEGDSKGIEAARVIASARSALQAVGSTTVTHFDERWKSIVDEVGEHN